MRRKLKQSLPVEKIGKNKLLSTTAFENTKKICNLKVDRGEGGPEFWIFSVGKNDRKPAFIERKLTQKNLDSKTS